MKTQASEILGRFSLANHSRPGFDWIRDYVRQRVTGLKRILVYDDPFDATVKVEATGPTNKKAKISVYRNSMVICEENRMMETLDRLIAQITPRKPRPGASRTHVRQGFASMRLV